MMSFTNIAWRLVLITMATGYFGSDPISFTGDLVQDFSDGFKGHPAQMRYRPQWQNFGSDW